MHQAGGNIQTIRNWHQSCIYSVDQSTNGWMKVPMKKFFFKVLLLVIVVLAVFVIFVKAAPDTPRLDGFGMGYSAELRVGAQQIPNVLDNLHSLGVGWVRESVPWNEVQTNSGEFRWAYGTSEGYRDFNQLLIELKSRNMDMLAVLDGGPVFLQHTYPDQPVDHDKLLEAWKQYVQAAVNQLGSVVHAWEIGDEPNSPEYWGGLLYPTVENASYKPDAGLYAEMLKIASQVIKAADPKDVIILGGLDLSLGAECSTDAFSFLGQLRKAGAWDSFDIIGVHFFWGSNKPQDSVLYGVGHDPLDGTCKPLEKTSYTMIEEVRLLQAFTVQAGAKPIWVTAIGWQQSELQALAVRDGSQDALEESDMVARSMIPLLSEENVQKVFWFNMFDDARRPGYQLGPFGQQTYSDLATLLTGSQVLGRFTEPLADIEEYRFQKDGKTLIVAFRTSGGTEPAVFKLTGLQGMNAVAFPADSVGLSTDTANAVAISVDGSAAVTLTERPTIIIASSGDPLESLKLGVEDRVSVLSTSVRSGVSNLLGNLKASALRGIGNWLDGIKQNLVNSVKNQLDKAIP
jgi:hypothetical protein